ncbi:MAG: hypothetical protein J6Q52_00215 [Clostridia bacterium]|nr:hypothetical protein [Clostridia bacterium]
MAKYRKKSNTFISILVVVLCFSLCIGIFTHLSRSFVSPEDVVLYLNGEKVSSEDNIYLKQGETINFKVVSSSESTPSYSVKIVANPKLAETYTYSFGGDLIQQFDKTDDYILGFDYSQIGDVFTLTLPYGCETALDVLQRMHSYTIDEGSIATTVPDNVDDATSYFTLVVEYEDSCYEMDLYFFRYVNEVALNMEGLVL